MPIRHPRSRPAAPLLATALALLVALLLPGAATADGWLHGPSLTFSDDPGGSLGGTFAELGTDAAGTTSLAWAAYDRATAGIDVRLTRIAPDGSAAPPRSLGSAVDLPSLAVTPTGETALAWPDGSGAVKLLRVPAGGEPQPALTVAPGSAQKVRVGIGDSGDAIVIWDDSGQLNIRRVAASGALGPHTTIADGLVRDAQVAVAHDGTAWLAWINDVDGRPWAARLTADGALDGVPVELSGDEAQSLDLVAGADGAVVSWTEDAGTDDRALLRRLSARGAVAAPATELAVIGDNTLPEVAIAPGGAVEAVYVPPVPGGSGVFPTSTAVLRRVEPSGALGPERPLAASSSTLGSLSPRISAGGDGSATVTWVDIASDGLTLAALQLRPDGTTTPTTTISGVFPLFALSSTSQISLVATSRLGVATAAWPELDRTQARVVTARLDAIAPVVEPVVPETVRLGSDASFAANVRDDGGIASVWWEFGDDGGSRRAATRHRYADPGTYTATVTVVDHAGNETTVARQVTVVAPPPPTTPTPVRVAAALRIGRITRKGARITVTGTLDQRASGSVTATYAQRIGRRSRQTRATATIAGGRFATTIRLTGALARARGGTATVSLAYTGDDDTDAAGARRTVNVPRARSQRRKPKPRRRAGARR